MKFLLQPPLRKHSDGNFCSLRAVLWQRDFLSAEVIKEHKDIWITHWPTVLQQRCRFVHDGIDKICESRFLSETFAGCNPRRWGCCTETRVEPQTTTAATSTSTTSTEATFLPSPPTEITNGKIAPLLPPLAHWYLDLLHRQPLALVSHLKIVRIPLQSRKHQRIPLHFRPWMWIGDNQFQDNKQSFILLFKVGVSVMFHNVCFYFERALGNKIRIHTPIIFLDA